MGAWVLSCLLLLGRTDGQVDGWRYGERHALSRSWLLGGVLGRGVGDAQSPPRPPSACWDQSVAGPQHRQGHQREVVGHPGWGGVPVLAPACRGTKATKEIEMHWAYQQGDSERVRGGHGDVAAGCMMGTGGWPRLAGGARSWDPEGTVSIASAKDGTQRRVICSKNLGHGICPGLRAGARGFAGPGVGQRACIPQAPRVCFPAGGLGAGGSTERSAGVFGRKKALEIVPLLPCLRFEDRVISETYCKWKKCPRRKESKEGKRVGAGAQREGSTYPPEPLGVPPPLFPFCSFWALIKHQLNPAQPPPCRGRN